MAPAIIYECHDEIDETSVSNQTDTQSAENTTIAESVDFFSKRTITIFFFQHFPTMHRYNGMTSEFTELQMAANCLQFLAG